MWWVFCVVCCVLLHGNTTSRKEIQYCQLCCSCQPETRPYGPESSESRNLALYSTNVVEGVGTGVVIKTGDETVMGSIAGLVASLDSGKTPINKEVE